MYVKLFLSIILCINIINLQGFIVNNRINNKLYKLQSVVTNEDHNWVVELIQNIFRALPDVLKPIKEPDQEHIIPNPPKYIKPDTAGHKKNSYYSSEDIIANFNRKYLSEPLTKPKQLIPILEELDELNLLESVDDHIHDKHFETLGNLAPDSLIKPFVDAEKYLIESLGKTFTPIDPEINKDKVVPSPKPFKKSLTLSKLKKELKKKYEYYK
mmetsp:Transcript_5405/g.4864  ORF Transcript_5405/g.4864 Transcript_5405/m.4864 type:complete len:213 (-) Transcript_5405:117-755(-)